MVTDGVYTPEADEGLHWSLDELRARQLERLQATVHLSLIHISEPTRPY